jgi:hypothetical protein
MRVEGDVVAVKFRDGRMHRVRLVVSAETVSLEATAVSAADARAAAISEADMWRWNKGTRVTGFRFDPKGRVVGHAYAPIVGLTDEALRAHVRALAEECDHFERVMTGQDEY